MTGLCDELAETNLIPALVDLLISVSLLAPRSPSPIKLRLTRKRHMLGLVFVDKYLAGVPSLKKSSVRSSGKKVGPNAQP